MSDIDNIQRECSDVKMRVGKCEELLIRTNVAVGTSTYITEYIFIQQDLHLALLYMIGAVSTMALFHTPLSYAIGITMLVYNGVKYLKSCAKRNTLLNTIVGDSD